MKLCGWAWAGCGAVACTVRDAAAAVPVVVSDLGNLGMRRPLASNANSLRLFAAHLPVFGSMRRLATRMCAWGLRPSLSVWMAYVQA